MFSDLSDNPSTHFDQFITEGAKRCKLRRMRLILVIGFLLFIPQYCCGPGPRADPGDVHEIRVPHSDGATAKKAVHRGLCPPKMIRKTYPILIENGLRTTSKPYGVDQYPSELGPSPLFAKDGYIFVYQDVRGRWMSEGDIDRHGGPHLTKKGPQRFRREYRTRGTPSIGWSSTFPHNKRLRLGNGVFSYPGFYTAAGMIDAHPALKAASPQAPINDWFVGDELASQRRP